MNALTNARKSLREKSVMRFVVEHPDDEEFDGIVIRITSHFIAVQIAEDFEFSGVGIVPITHLRAVENKAREKCATTVMQHNRQHDKLKIPQWLNTCETLPDIFLQLKKRDIWPAVMVAHRKDSWFFIGKITLAEEAGFYIHSYSETGTWVKETGLRMQDVAMLEFGGQYEKHFNRYMRDCVKR